PDRRDPPPCPTRRSSDLGLLAVKDAILSSHQEQTGDDLQTVPLSLHVKGSVSAATDAASTFQSALHVPLTARGRQLGTLSLFARDRKSTRLNSSHVKISY